MDYKRETADNRRLPAVYFCTGGEARTLMTFLASPFIECQITMFLVKHYYYKLICPKYVRRHVIFICFLLLNIIIFESWVNIFVYCDIDVFLNNYFLFNKTCISRSFSSRIFFK